MQVDNKPTESFYLSHLQSVKSSSDQYYKNIGFIGKGGNGVAYLVLCTSGPFKGQIFVLKGLYRISSPERIQRFWDEVAFLEDQSNPSIMRFFDKGVFANRPFMVTSYLPNTLFDELKKGVTLGKAFLYSTQLLSALKHLHSKQVVHRDIKPQNIFINNTRAILGDFGLIKHVNNDSIVQDDVQYMNENIAPSEVFTGYVAMPFFYRTPELVDYANGKGNITTSSDVFQLGLVVAEMFTGKNPLKKANSITDPIELNPIGKVSGDQFSRRIINAVERMLKFNPEDRPSVDKLLDDFTGLYGDYAKAKYNLDGSSF